MEVKYQNADKQKIKNKIEKINKFIDSKIQERSKLFLRDASAILIPTQIIVPLTIDDEPVSPKTKLIMAVSVVLGLFMGVFLALLRKAYLNHKQEKLKNHQ